MSRGRWMRSAVPLSLLCAVAWCVAAPAARGETAVAPLAWEHWTEFRSEPGRFAVRLPAEPIAESSSRLTLAGRVYSTVYRFRRGDLELSVEHHDLPTLAHMFVSEQALLDRAETGLVGNEGGAELRCSKIRDKHHQKKDTNRTF